MPARDGRKPKLRQRRDVPLTVMLTRREREALHRLALKVGVGDSVCARMLILKGVRAGRQGLPGIGPRRRRKEVIWENPRPRV